MVSTLSSTSAPAADLLLVAVLLALTLAASVSSALPHPQQTAYGRELEEQLQRFALPKRPSSSSSFVGMRGKKDDDEEEEELIKRASFMGMRGKKEFKSGFVGMRGKKAMEEEQESYGLPLGNQFQYLEEEEEEEDRGKRAGFVGMRGKKDREDQDRINSAYSSVYGYQPKARRGGGSSFVGMRGR